MCQCSDPRWGNCADEGNDASPSGCLIAPSKHTLIHAEKAAE